MIDTIRTKMLNSVGVRGEVHDGETTGQVTVTISTFEFDQYVHYVHVNRHVDDTGKVRGGADGN